MPENILSNLSYVSNKRKKKPCFIRTIFEQEKRGRSKILRTSPSIHNSMGAKLNREDQLE